MIVTAELARAKALRQACRTRLFGPRTLVHAAAHRLGIMLLRTLKSRSGLERSCRSRTR